MTSSDPNAYRKKPKIIRAFKMTENRIQHQITWPEWLREAWDRSFEGENGLFPAYYHFPDAKTNEIAVRTLEGIYKVKPGWWIIEGIKGELYPCEPMIFKETYEKV